ncbi:hypothetical protein [Arenibacterium halophilum]|uniref:Uncharacterized protein n=1 Tax=Arenibacterium halophilum TaxID=2583821 RepID=A0ABY2WXR1_9RHOB|nr:hypothetical protein [Arenibacterium halophilum]TMV07322.1 hypothetical protein FGK64_21975 [Arenibacterium halophilum]
MLTRSQASVTAELEARRRAATAEVNATIGTRRQEFITDIPGQEMIYREKITEATLYLAAPILPAELTDYPLLSAEIGITAPDATALATLWLSMGAQWKRVGAELEAIRQAALLAISAAPDGAGVATALSAFRAAYAAWTPPPAP